MEKGRVLLELFFATKGNVTLHPEIESFADTVNRLIREYSAKTIKSTNVLHSERFGHTGYFASVEFKVDDITIHVFTSYTTEEEAQQLLAPYHVEKVEI